MNSAENVSLKPCPFCGGAAIQCGANEHNPRHWVMCRDCHACPNGDVPNLADAISAWNHRAISGDLVEDDKLQNDLQAAYDKVKDWPENRMPGVDITTLGEGFIDLLQLRNLIPATLSELAAQKKKAQPNENSRSITEPSEAKNTTVAREKLADCNSGVNADSAYRNGIASGAAMNSAENVSLKPCPFCGGEGHLSFYSSTTVECLSCDAAMEGLYSTPELAIAAWNLRSPPTEDADRVEVAGDSYHLTEYELQVLLGTTISGCNMPPDRVFSLPVAWGRLKAIGLIDRADGLAIATDKGRAVVRRILSAASPRPETVGVSDGEQND